MKNRLFAMLTVLIVFSMFFPTMGITTEKYSAASIWDHYLVCLPVMLRNWSSPEASGMLDPMFDEDGLVITEVGENARASDLVLQTNGKIIVAGYVETANGYDFALVRYTTNGSLDTAFDGDGIVITDFGDDDYGKAVALQSDGKILAAGYTGSEIDQINTGDFAVARYLTDGTLDPSFNGNGKVTTDFFGYSDIAYAVAVQPDGKIVLAGRASVGTSVPYYYDFALARYTPTGTLDTTFGNNGIVTTDFASDNDKARSIAIQEDGNILVVGYTGYSTFTMDFAIARYTSTGSLDTNFSSDGKVITDFDSHQDYAYSSALQPDGKIVVVGTSEFNFGKRFALARYYSDGSLDLSFGLGGKVINDFISLGGTYGAYDVALQPNGKILVVGVIPSSAWDFGLARYNPDGSLDVDFDGDGVLTTDIYGSDNAQAVALQPDGMIVVAGWSGTPAYFTVARYK